MSAGVLRETLQAAFVGALESTDLAGVVARSMPREAAHVRGGITVLAVGKAASAMARGALSVASAASGRVRSALVIRPAGGPIRASEPAGALGAEILEAPHPDPDRRSVVAARRALELVASSAFTLALVSGGASSLICLPRGLSLARYMRLVRALLLGGATVREVNVVRRHLCSVKGGGLARVAGGPVHTLAASDVIGGGFHDVGSGPTVADPTTCAQARAVLGRFAPRLTRPRMHESLKPGAPAARCLRASFVLRPEDLARAVARELETRDLVARVLEPSVAQVTDLARDYVSRARALRPGEAVVRAAEPTLRVGVARPGRGGRSTHLAVLVGRDLPDGVAFLAGASDGVDGASGTAGAVVDASLASRISPEAVARSLAEFDTARTLLAAGMALHLGPTGNNLADVHVLARAWPGWNSP